MFIRCSITCLIFGAVIATCAAQGKNVIRMENGRYIYEKNGKEVSESEFKKQREDLPAGLVLAPNGRSLRHKTVVESVISNSDSITTKGVRVYEDGTTSPFTRRAKVLAPGATTFNFD